jgi:hypothetical protein
VSLEEEEGLAESFLEMECPHSLRPTVFVSQAEEGMGLVSVELEDPEDIQLQAEGILEMELGQVTEEVRREEDLDFNCSDNRQAVETLEMEVEEEDGLEEASEPPDWEAEEDRVSSVVPMEQRLDLESRR